MLLQRMNLPNIKAETVIEQYVAVGMLQVISLPYAKFV